MPRYKILRPFAEIQLSSDGKVRRFIVHLLAGAQLDKEVLALVDRTPNLVTVQKRRNPKGETKNATVQSLEEARRRPRVEGRENPRNHIFLPRGATLNPENTGVPRVVENQHGICPQVVRIDSSSFVNFKGGADTNLLRNGVLGPKTAKERLVVADAERRRKPMIVVPTI